ncbi:ribonuclease catalytic domain-containing protein [Candidatus Kinetoplastidibacterium desouzai]|nr:ribonuclease catalytic domain-containing protein [Candidatus Kinetoplastibacterium desouzaii]
MHVLYEENGNFKTAIILSKTDANFLVETEHGKKIKLKINNCLLHFTSPKPNELLEQAATISNEMDIVFLWECAPQEIFFASDLAIEYFGNKPSPIELTSILIKLHNAPIYFYKKGQGQYIKATEEKILLALASIKKKKQLEEEEEYLTSQLVNGYLPDIIKQQALSLINNPDKKSIYWKALEKACNQLNKNPETLLIDINAWPNYLTLLKEKFIYNNFPNGVIIKEDNFIDINLDKDIPISNAEIYSIDDINTTEIDDGISIRKIENNTITIGIHIAAPALGIIPGSQYDSIARARSSTIYMPGEKITMQPEKIIKIFSLDANKLVPAISLYVTINSIDGSIIEYESLIEQVSVKENLRINLIEEIATKSNIENSNITNPLLEWIRPLWKTSQLLSLQREKTRGSPENLSRQEYSFTIDGDPNNPSSKIYIEKRPRDNPISIIVAEFMILANSLWGQMLKQHGVPGIYRSQQSFGRVKMSTSPLPHDKIGVSQYIWSTSPLRRYIDLVNQWQIISVIKHNVSARLVCPFKIRDNNLFSIIQEFETKYNSITCFQNEIENYWSIQWLIQQKIEITTATFIKESIARLNDVPLIVHVFNLPITIIKGELIKVKVININEISMEVNVQYIDTIINTDSNI